LILAKVIVIKTIG